MAKGTANLGSRAKIAMDAPPVRIEVHIARGLPKFLLVGLGDTAVRESRERVRAAIQSSGFDWPARRVVVNLAPADLPKDGARYDLGIALGILAASGQITHLPADHEYLGELSLEGAVRPVSGLLPSAIEVRRSGHVLVLAEDNVAEASLADGLRVKPVRSLTDAVVALGDRPAQTLRSPKSHGHNQSTLWQSIQGQSTAMRALTLAVAGAHHVLMVGTPGIGKSMLASCMPALMPALKEDEALEVCALYSLADEAYDTNCWRRRPFRKPHHGISTAALVGGGNIPRPGEISLAHMGLLFLDEMTLFDQRTLESLRQPLEERHISVSRTKRKVRFPAAFQLVAAMNPCPCGYLGHATRSCLCTQDQIARYHAKVSGPLADRIDIQLQMHMPNQEHRARKQDDLTEVQARIAQAIEIQLERQSCLNAQLSADAILKHCILDTQAQTMMQRISEQVLPSMRSRSVMLKLARTVADMDAAAMIRSSDLAEALQLRSLDRFQSGLS